MSKKWELPYKNECMYQNTVMTVFFSYPPAGRGIQSVLTLCGGICMYAEWRLDAKGFARSCIQSEHACMSGSRYTTACFDQYRPTHVECDAMWSRVGCYAHSSHDYCQRCITTAISSLQFRKKWNTTKNLEKNKQYSLWFWPLIMFVFAYSVTMTDSESDSWLKLIRLRHDAAVYWLKLRLIYHRSWRLTLCLTCHRALG